MTQRAHHKAPPWDEARKARFCRMVREGFENAEIAERFGLHGSTVRYWAEQFGVEKPSRKLGSYGGQGGRPGSYRGRGGRLGWRWGGDAELIEEVRRTGKGA